MLKIAVKSHFCARISIANSRPRNFPLAKKKTRGNGVVSINPFSPRGSPLTSGVFGRSRRERVSSEKNKSKREIYNRQTRGPHEGHAPVGRQDRRQRPEGTSRKFSPYWYFVIRCCMSYFRLAVLVIVICGEFMSRDVCW